MTSPERQPGLPQHISLKPKLTLKQVAPWLLLGTLLGAGAMFLYKTLVPAPPDPDDDRPPIIVRNGSVIVEEINNGEPGQLVRDTTQPTLQVWQHKHARRATWRFSADVSGIQAGVGDCGSTGQFFVSKLESAAIYYTITPKIGVPSVRSFLVKTAQPSGSVPRLLEFTLDSSATPYQDPTKPHQFEADQVAGATVLLDRVILTKRSAGATHNMTCYFDSTATPELRLIQGR